MLRRRGLFNDGFKGMVRHWVGGEGSMLGQNDGCFLFCGGPKLIGGVKMMVVLCCMGPQTNWWPKPNLEGTKNN